MTLTLKDKQILITGASGSLASQLIYELMGRGIRPIAHLRKTSEAPYVERLNLERRWADIRNREELQELVKGIDCIIHTAACVNFRQDRLTQFTGVNTVGAVDLFRAAQRAGVQRFVHVSTIAAIAGQPRRGKSDDAPVLINEEDEFNLEHLRIPYIMTKHAAEDGLLAALKDGDTELVIVNPSIIVAPSRTGDDRGKAMRSINNWIMPDLPIWVNLADIRDVAPGIIAALQDGRNGERYVLGGDNISARDLVLAISSILGRTPHLCRFPNKFFHILARIAVVGGKLLGRSKVSFYPDLVKMLDYDWAFSSRKARQDLCYSYRSVYQTLENLLTNEFHGTYMKS